MMKFRISYPSNHQNSKKSLPWMPFFVLLGMLCFANGLFAQSLTFRYASDTRVQYANSQKKDYIEVKARYCLPEMSDVSSSKKCACGNKFVQAELYKGSRWLPPVIYKQDGISTCGLFSPVLVHGPSERQTYYVDYWVVGFGGFLCLDGCRKESRRAMSNTIATVGIRRPGNVKATQNKLGEVVLTWNKRTDIPNGKHVYIIYRDGRYIAEVDGATRSYIDRTAGPDAKHTYAVSTYGFRQESVKVEAVGESYELNFRFDTLQGLKDEVRLQWFSVRDSDDGENVRLIEIYRDEQKIKDLDPNITRTVDQRGIPGFPHEYSMKIVMKDESVIEGFDAMKKIAYRLPNGQIKGSIRSKSGVPIPNIEVCATSTSGVPNDLFPSSVCGVTNSAGDYSLERIYYGEQDTIEVRPVHPTRAFLPTSRKVFLEIGNPSDPTALNVYDAPVDFTDKTSITIVGAVTQADCAIENVIVQAELLNQDRQVLRTYETTTLTDGTYSLAVDDPGEYVITPLFRGHSFSPASIERTFVDESNSLPDFKNTQTRKLSGKVLGGCDSYLGKASLLVYDKADCYKMEVETDTAGYFNLDVPAKALTVRINRFTPNEAAQLANVTAENFTNLDPIEVDLTDEAQTADFIFRLPLEVEVEFSPAAFSLCGSYEYPILGQYARDTILIRVNEALGTTSCPVDTGTLTINDEISDRVAETFPIENGIVKYIVEPGDPKISGDHLKTFEVTATVGNRTSAPVVERALVIGNLPTGTTFTTVTPEIPYLILRDPPGDRSYSFYKNTTQVTRSSTLFAPPATVGLANKAVLIGKKIGNAIKSDPRNIKKPSISLEEIKDFIGSTLKVSEYNWDQKEMTFVYGSTEELKTSDSDAFIGAEGDLYIGHAMNLSYSLTDVIEFDVDSCKVDVSQSLIFALNETPTRFIYSQKGIQEQIIPNLKELLGQYINEFVATNDSMLIDSMIYYQSQIEVWEKTIKRNEALKSKARKVENLSLDGGASITSDTTFTSTESFSLDFSAKIDQSLATTTKINAQVGFEFLGSGIQTEFTIIGNTHVNFGIQVGLAEGLEQLSSQQVGYTIADDDTDIISVDILSDPVYGTPVFKTVAGTTSCPHEPNTRARDRIEVSADRFTQTNVSADFAEYKLKIANISESKETRTYRVSLLGGSNSEGADVRINGRFSDEISIEYGEEATVTVRIYKEGNACAYPNIGILVQPQCAEEEEIEGLVELSTYFECDCGSASLSSPASDWVLSSNDAEELLIRIEDYDLDLIKRVILEYATTGSNNWQEDYRLERSDLEATTTSFFWTLPDWEDDRYQLRLKILCSESDAYSYSNIVTGTLDRAAPFVIDTPEPADNLYENGDVIRLMFNEILDCENTAATISNGDTSLIVQIECVNDLLVLQAQQSELSQFAGQLVEVFVTGIEDQYGNISTDTLSWDFEVAADIGEDMNKLEQRGSTKELDAIGIYPNPTSGVLILKLPITPSTVTNIIQLYDFRGQLLQSWNSNGEQTLELDLGRYAEGIYLLRAMIDGEISVQEVVVQR